MVRGHLAVFPASAAHPQATILTVNMLAEMDEPTAIKLVEERVAEMAEPDLTYPLVGIREHPDSWAIAVQPTRPDGQPLYDIMGFDVDKRSGEVRQTI